jgi:DNA-binding IclR family transcriptional regulator
MIGAQSLERAVLILRIVSHHNRAGARLTDITTATALAQPTVHRILAGLMHEGLVAQDRESKRYFLGQVIAEFGLTAAARYDTSDLFRASISRLAAESEDTVFASRRSGLDMVCVDRRSGTHPSQAFVLDVGVRRPLGVGGSSLALLSALPPTEAREILDANARTIALFEQAPDERYYEELAQFARQGYAQRDIHGIDVHTVAVPILDGDGMPFAAFSLSTFHARMPPERIPAIVAMLRREATWVQKRLQAEQAMALEAAG